MKTQHIILPLVISIFIFLSADNASAQFFTSGGYQGGTHGSGGDEILVGTESREESILNGMFTSYPNPFHLETSFRFTLVSQGSVEISIYDMNSRLVRILLPCTEMQRGTYTLVWDGNGDDGRQVSRGMYYYRCTLGNKVITAKIVYI